VTVVLVIVVSGTGVFFAHERWPVLETKQRDTDPTLG